MPAMMFDMGLFDMINKMHRIMLHSKLVDKDETRLKYSHKN